MTDLYPTPIAAALMYGVLGWKVAPVKPGSKVPAISDWVNAASSDETTIRSWWESPQHAHDGVCIITGRESGVWVLDVDVANGKVGLDTLKALVADNGADGLGETLVVRTPSGGYHYYFTYPEDAEVHNSASNRLGAGLDVRGEGGQVNAPPTQRGETGYRWADGRAPWAADALPAPAWLLDLVKDRPKAITPAPVHTAGAALQIRQGVQLLDTVPGFVTDYNGANSWEALLMADGWTQAHTDGQGVTYWARPGKEAREGISASTNFGGSDLLYVWSTSLDWLPSDRAYDRYGYMVRRRFAGDFDAAAQHFVAERRDRENAGSRIDPADLIASNPPIGDVVTPDLLADEPEDDDVERSKFEAALMPLWSPDFWDADPTAKDFLIEPFLARGRAHALYASAKAGKSYVALQAIAAASVPKHRSWAETPEPLVQALYLDYEMTEDDLRERLQIFGYGPDDDYSRLHYVKASLLGADLDTKEGGRELLDQALAWGVQLVVVDTMSRAVSGDENDADTVRRFYQHTGRLLKAHGIAWLRIDHAGKDGEKGQRGSSAKNDDVDIVWRLERLDAGARLTRTHSRVFWVDDEILLSNVHHEDGSLHHERTDSVDKIAGLGAKAQEWVDRGISLDVTRDSLRNEYGFSFKDPDFPKIKKRAQEIADLAEMAPGSRARSLPFALGTVAPSGQTKSVPSLAPPKGGQGNHVVAGTEPAELPLLTTEVAE